MGNAEDTEIFQSITIETEGAFTMAIKTSTLRPGLLVSLKSSVTGNVTYTRRDLGQKVMKNGAEEARWETERTITDPAEHEAAIKTRTQARLAITRVCSSSAFGLLCPEDAADELEKAIAEARKIAEAFNETAKLTRVGIYVITGRIAPDDVEAVRAINSEVRDLLKEMERGLKNLDVKAVRDAAMKAKSIGTMLSPDAQSRITIAIEAARKSAKQIVKAGEQVSMEIDNRTIKKIAEQRTAFLDFDEAKPITAPKAKAVAVDLDPSVKAASDEYISKKKRERARAIEMD